MDTLNCCELEKLVEAGHTLFKAIEGRDLAYEILKKFVECGYRPYSNINQDLDKLKEEVDNWIDYNEEKKEAIKGFIETIKGSPTLGSLALLFLLSWNMNRYKDCDNFSKEKLEEYAKHLNEELEKILSSLEFLKDRTIKDVEWKEIRKDLEEIEEILKSKQIIVCFKKNCSDCQHEYIGAIKLASVFLPNIVIPIDNPIAEALCLKNPKQPFSLKIYEEFWGKIKELTERCPNLVTKLKYIDELFYVLFSLKQKVRNSMREKFGFTVRDYHGKIKNCRNNS